MQKTPNVEIPNVSFHQKSQRAGRGKFSKSNPRICGEMQNTAVKLGNDHFGSSRPAPALHPPISLS